MTDDERAELETLRASRSELEGEVARLREALEEIWNVPVGEHLNRARDIARSALAETEQA